MTMLVSSPVSAVAVSRRLGAVRALPEPRGDAVRWGNAKRIASAVGEDSIAITFVREVLGG